MKKRRFLFLLFYIAVILTCFVLLSFLDVKPKKPDGGESTATREQQAELPETESTEETESTAETAEETDGESTEDRAREHESAVDRFPPNQDGNADGQRETEEETKPLKLVIASDTHYLSPDLTDFGAAYEKFLWKDDGKVLDYSPQIMDAFAEEVIALQPTAVIISGDLTLNGERVNHLRFAEKLKLIQDAGIQVLVIPGNHDINNANASEFVGKERLPVESVNAGEFREIYNDFGYAQASDQDETSLSYLYKLDEKNWLMMIDSCQYEPVNLVGGKIRDTTYMWMEKQLVEARKEGALIIPIAHHNLLEESRLYTFDCIIEDNKRFIGMLEWWRLPVYFSGHLHLQRIKKYKFEPGAPDDAYSISEIVSNSLAISPNQYGVVSWDDSGGISYETVPLKVSSWAEKSGSTDQNLLEFETYSTDFLISRVASQIAGEIYNLPEEQIEAMSALYGSLNEAYCAGIPIDRKAVESDRAYRFWERNLPHSPMFQEMQLIMKDSRNDNNGFFGDGVADYPD